MQIKEAQKKVYENAVNKDFYDNIMWAKGALEEKEIDGRRYRKLMAALIDAEIQHIHSEVDEAYKAHRDGDAYQMGLELADVILMAMSVAGVLEMDIEEFIVKKIHKNEPRPPLHGHEI